MGCSPSLTSENVQKEEKGHTLGIVVLVLEMG